MVSLLARGREVRGRKVLRVERYLVEAAAVAELEQSVWVIITRGWSLRMRTPPAAAASAPVSGRTWTTVPRVRLMMSRVTGLVTTLASLMRSWTLRYHSRTGN